MHLLSRRDREELQGIKVEFALIKQFPRMYNIQRKVSSYARF